MSVGHVLLDFDQGTTPGNPISVQEAVGRGQALVNRPVKIAMGILLLSGYLAVRVNNELLAGLFLIATPILPWFWWSYAVPRWRAWALSRGADPERLQELAQQVKLVWPRGHFFERTEFTLPPDWKPR